MHILNHQKYLVPIETRIQDQVRKSKIQLIQKNKFKTQNLVSGEYKESTKLSLS